MMFLNIYVSYDDNSSNKNKRTKNTDKFVDKNKTTNLWTMLTKKTTKNDLQRQKRTSLPPYIAPYRNFVTA